MESLLDRRTTIRSEQIKAHETNGSVFNSAMVDAEADVRVDEINRILNLINK